VLELYHIRRGIAILFLEIVKKLWDISREVFGG